jgi:hypothetical protein
MNKKKILIIGAGGIGSYLIPLLQKVKLYEITAADPDKVEKKNLTYQNFDESHVFEQKVTVMQRKYKISHAHPYYVLTDPQLEGYDLIVCCADNLDVRRLLYRSKKTWLDLRAQGRNCAFVTSMADPKMYDTLLAGPEGSFSCQGDTWDGSNQNVHFMQVVAAGMGAQWIQRFFAGNDVADFKVVNV